MSERGRIALRIGLGALALVLLGTFAYAHGDQRVRLDFALFVLRDVPLPVALYGAIILGMLIVLAVSLKADLRVGAGSGPYGPPDDVREDEPDTSRGDGGVFEEADRRV